MECYLQMPHERSALLQEHPAWIKALPRHARIHSVILTQHFWVDAVINGKSVVGVLETVC